MALRTDCEPIEGRTPCNWGESFRSVVVTGTASIVESMEERRLGLQRLMAQQAGIEDAPFTDAQVGSVTVWRIDVDHMTGKIRPAPSRSHRPAGFRGDGCMLND